MYAAAMKSKKETKSSAAAYSVSQIKSGSSAMSPISQLKQKEGGTTLSVAQRLLLTAIEPEHGNFKEAQNLILRTAMKNKELGALITFARKSVKYNLHFDVSTGKGLEEMEKGGGGAAAATGLFASDMVCVNDESDYTLIGKPRNTEEVSKLRKKIFTVRIIINLDMVSEHTMGKAIQIVAHEYAVHAIKYLPLLEMIENDRISDEELFRYMKIGFTVPMNKSDLIEDVGRFTPVMHHKEMLEGLENREKGYGALKTGLLEVLEEDDRAQFNEREIADVQSIIPKVRHLMK